jgi:flavodoxin
MKSKKIVLPIVCMFMMVLLSACGGKGEKTGDVPFAEVEKTETENMDEADVSVTENPKEDTGTEKGESGKTLIAYFSRVGNTDFADDVDAVTSASLLVKDNRIYGNTQYVATLVQKAAGGDLFLIETKEKYPSDYDETDKQGEKENREKARPELASHVENLDEYTTVFLGFPNWYYDMPMAVYSFLEEHDLSGKTIIPFVTSGGSGFSDAISAIKELEPDAGVVEDGFETTHSKVDEVTFDGVKAWVNGLGIEKK